MSNYDYQGQWWIKLQPEYTDTDHASSDPGQASEGDKTQGSLQAEYQGSPDTKG